MKIFNLKDFTKKRSLKDDTLSENDIQKVYVYHMYLKSSEVIRDRGY